MGRTGRAQGKDTPHQRMPEKMASLGGGLRIALMAQRPAWGSQSREKVLGSDDQKEEKLVVNALPAQVMRGLDKPWAGGAGSWLSRECPVCLQPAPKKSLRILRVTPKPQRRGRSWLPALGPLLPLSRRRQAGDGGGGGAGCPI